MRSLLFVPADAAKKLDKAMASGADAVIVDLEDSIAPERKAAARDLAAAFVRDAVKAQSRPRILVRINGLATGLTDTDLDAIVAARPDAIMFPKAEGGAAIIHVDAKLAVREAIAGLPAGRVQLQDLDDLLFRKPALLHRPLLSSGGLYTSQWAGFTGSGHKS